MTKKINKKMEIERKRMNSYIKQDLKQAVSKVSTSKECLLEIETQRMSNFNDSIEQLRFLSQKTSSTVKSSDELCESLRRLKELSCFEVTSVVHTINLENFEDDRKKLNNKFDGFRSFIKYQKGKLSIISHSSCEFDGVYMLEYKGINSTEKVFKWYHSVAHN